MRSSRRRWPAFLADKLEDAIYKPTKVEHTTAVGALNHALNLHIKEKFARAKEKINWKAVESLFEEMVNDVVHKNVLEKERRPDGRKLDEVRALDAEVGLFSRTHGSALLRPRQHAGARHHDARGARAPSR